MAARQRDAHRCRVCGKSFETSDGLEHHLRDQGLLW